MRGLTLTGSTPYLLVDSDGRPIGSFNGEFYTPAGGPTLQKLRLFLDADGRVVKVKVGKKTIR